MYYVCTSVPSASLKMGSTAYAVRYGYCMGQAATYFTAPSTIYTHVCQLIYALNPCQLYQYATRLKKSSFLLVKVNYVIATQVY